ncbi:hypothetical protein Q8F55_008441 [Vanrija albida]|uniref:Zn(2)-C6 fungal-type domain-containing protein n=1 Tax=Vanrija albida TaxID=181172 RepID=A0ABR3PQV0_9TREE
MDHDSHQEASPSTTAAAVAAVTSGTDPDSHRPFKRSRIRQACDRCRARKSKCGDLRPCEPCISAGVTCEDWRPGGSTPIKHESDGVYVPSAPATAPPRQRHAVTNDWPLVPRDGRFLRLAFPYDTIYRTERGSHTCFSFSSGLGLLQYLHEHHKLVNPEPGAGMEDPLSFLLDMPANPLLPPLLTVPPEERDAGGSKGQDVVDEALWTQLSEQVGLTIIWTLVRQFLETSYLFWPTFLLREFVELSQDPRERCKPDFICLLLSICALACRESGAGRTTKEDPSEALFDLYWQVRRRYPTADWSTLTSIQSVFYLAMYCYGGSGPNGVVMGHTLANEAVSRALDIGLHRSVEVYSQTFARHEVAVRARTLWAVFCVDKIQMAYGRPPMLRLCEIDIDEIPLDVNSTTERLTLGGPTYLPYQRACVRLYMVLERVIEKINIPACTASSVINQISQGSRRIRETAVHPEGCACNHQALDFDDELKMINTYRSQDLPPSSQDMEDDNIFHCHIERLRTLAAWVKVFIYRHLFAVHNTDVGIEYPSRKYAKELLHWSQDLLASQRKILQRGSLTDCGAICSYQISQVGRGLIPVLYLSKHMTPEQQEPLGQHPEAFRTALSLAVKLLGDLGMRFPASARSMDIIDAAARRLDVDITLEGEVRLPGHVRRPPRSQSDRWMNHLPLSNPLAMPLLTSSFDFVGLATDADGSNIFGPYADFGREGSQQDDGVGASSSGVDGEHTGEYGLSEHAPEIQALLGLSQATDRGDSRS